MQKKYFILHFLSLTFVDIRVAAYEHDLRTCSVKAEIVQNVPLQLLQTGKEEQDMIKIFKDLYLRCSQMNGLRWLFNASSDIIRIEQEIIQHKQSQPTDEMQAKVETKKIHTIEETMDQKKCVHHLMERVLLDICLAAKEQDYTMCFLLADIMHNVPSNLIAVEEGRQDYVDALDEMYMRIIGVKELRSGLITP